MGNKIKYVYHQTAERRVFSNITDRRILKNNNYDKIEDQQVNDQLRKEEEINPIWYFIC